jgi:CRISPR/Cas system Type II protein with McrA/HNH and RuvC-like nuclease domain
LVDHVIPRQVVQHDDIWNLVLAHAFCNAQKSDLLPGVDYVEKLIERNEHFIGSNHPIRPKLVAQLGTNPERRRRHIERVYGDARLVLGPAYTWEGIRGYHAATDPFYRSIIRKLKR